MWIMTNTGFISAVQLRGDATKLMIRARDRASLEIMFPGEKISLTPDGDYPYRVTVDRGVLAAALVMAVDDVDYSNFKNSISKDKRGDRLHKAFMRVWSVMHDVEDADSRVGRSPVAYNRLGDYVGTSTGSHKRGKKKGKNGKRGHISHELPFELTDEEIELDNMSLDEFLERHDLPKRGRSIHEMTDAEYLELSEHPSLVL